jgi:hypothetical protein
VHDVTAEKLIQPRALDPLRRQGPGCGKLLQQFRLGVVGQQQPAQAAGRVGQGGGDRVVAVQPDRALGNIRRVTLVVRALVAGALMVWSLMVRALIVWALMVWARDGRTEGMSVPRADRSLISLALRRLAVSSWALSPWALIPRLLIPVALIPLPLIAVPGFVIALLVWRVKALARRSRPLLAMSVRQRRRTGMRARAAAGRAGAAGGIRTRAGRKTGAALAG